MELRATLRSLADLVLDIEQHEALAELDEDEQIRQIESMRADIAKGNRIAEVSEEVMLAGLNEPTRRSSGRDNKRRKS